MKSIYNYITNFYDNNYFDKNTNKKIFYTALLLFIIQL